MNFHNKVASLYEKIKSQPMTLHEFVQFTEDVQSIEDLKPELLSESQSIAALDFLCKTHRISIGQKQSQDIKKAQDLMSTLNKRCEEIQQAQDSTIEKFRREFEKLVPVLNEKVKQLEELLEGSQVGRKTADIDQQVDFLETAGKQIKELDSERKYIFKYEVALQIGELTDFERLDNLIRQYQLMDDLWRGKQEWKNNFEDWQRMHLSQLDISAMSKLMEKFISISNKCSKEIAIGEVALAFKREVEKFKNMYLTLQSIKDKNIGPKHWEDIRQIVVKGKTQQELKDLNVHAEDLFRKLEEPKYTLQFLYKLQLDQYQEQIAEIAIKAAKEGELMHIISMVESFWKSEKIKCIQYKEKQDTYILATNEEMIAKLDDNILTINTILANKYVENIREKVEQQQKQMLYLQEL